MKKAILLAVLLTLVAFVSGVMAQGKPATTKPATTTAPAPAAKPEKFAGDIKSVDAVAKSLVLAKGKDEKTFVTTADTKITKGKEALKFEDLKAGMHVVIAFKKDGDKLIAETIKVATPKAAPKAK